MSHYINRSQAASMVSAYRKNPSGGKNADGDKQELSHFAHFTLQSFIQFLIDANIANAGTTMGELLEAESAPWGLKVYFAQHENAEDCPGEDDNYLGRNTVVLVKTVHDLEHDIWNEEFPGDAGVPGFDRTELRPPASIDKFPDSL